MTSHEIKEARLLVVAAKIDVLMAGQHVSQAELARRLETDRATVCRVLQGKGITVATLVAFLDVLGYEMTFTPKGAVSKPTA